MVLRPVVLLDDNHTDWDLTGDWDLSYAAVVNQMNNHTHPTMMINRSANCASCSLVTVMMC